MHQDIRILCHVYVKMVDEDIKGESKTAWCKQDVLTAVKC